MKNIFLESDNRFITGHCQPALVLDMALARGLDSHRLLRGTGLFAEDLQSGQSQLAPAQFLGLLANFQRHLSAPDYAFLLGQQMLPGHYGSASQMLYHARHTEEALQILCEFQALLWPLCCPRLLVTEESIYVYWLDDWGSAGQFPFLLQMAMAAVVGLCRWRSQQVLSWTFYFRQEEPRALEHHWLHLGEQLHFSSPLNAMMISRTDARRPWQESSYTQFSAAQVNARRELLQLPAKLSVNQAVFCYLLQNMQHSPDLESCARSFGMSAATLKRKLQKHGSGFQVQLDLARTCLALHLFKHQALTNEQVAARLGFGDVPNFRRAFKRWTGLSPAELRMRFMP